MDIKLGDCIKIGENQLNAVICRSISENGKKCDVVYLQNGRKAIVETVIHDGSEWSFEKDGPCGGYADGNSDLSQYVQKLRGG